MSYSLNEVQALAYKASRGAGLSWGMAEEAAHTTRRLCTYGVDGCAVLVEVLRHVEQSSEADIKPNTNGEQWRSNQTMSPLYAGVDLLDRSLILGAHALELTDVVAPIFLSPIIVSLASSWNTPVMLRGAGIEVLSTPNALYIDDQGKDLGDISIEKVDLKNETLNNVRDNNAITLVNRADIQAADYRALSDWAQRIFAPESETSRLKGAGAGVNDND